MGPVKKGDDELAALVQSGWGPWKRQHVYIGSGTIWHRDVDGKRGSTGLEGLLSEKAWLYRRTAGSQER